MSRSRVSPPIVVNLPKSKLEFSTAEKTVKLPLKAYGNLGHSGWDFPTWWAIDSEWNCWVDNAHGQPLFPVSSAALLDIVKDNRKTRQQIRDILGLPEEEPEWMAQAIAAGWGPKEKYDASADARIIAHAYIENQASPTVEDALTRVLEDERASYGPKTEAKAEVASTGLFTRRG